MEKLLLTERVNLIEKYLLSEKVSLVEKVPLTEKINLYEAGSSSTSTIDRINSAIKTIDSVEKELSKNADMTASGSYADFKESLESLLKVIKNSSDVSHMKKSNRRTGTSLNTKVFELNDLELNNVRTALEQCSSAWDTLSKANDADTTWIKKLPAYKTLSTAMDNLKVISKPAKFDKLNSDKINTAIITLNDALPKVIRDLNTLDNAILQNDRSQVYNKKNAKADAKAGVNASNDFYLNRSKDLRQILSLISNNSDVSGLFSSKENSVLLFSILDEIDSIEKESNTATRIALFKNLWKTSVSTKGGDNFVNQYKRLVNIVTSSDNGKKLKQNIDDSNWDKKYDELERKGTVTDQFWKSYITSTFKNNASKVLSILDVFKNECETLGFTEEQNPFIEFLRYAFDKNYNINKNTYEPIHDYVSWNVDNFLNQIRKDNKWNVIYNKQLYAMDRESIERTLYNQRQTTDGHENITDDDVRKLAAVLYGESDDEAAGETASTFVSEGKAIASVRAQAAKMRNLKINSITAFNKADTDALMIEIEKKSGGDEAKSKEYAKLCVYFLKQRLDADQWDAGAKLCNEILGPDFEATNKYSLDDIRKTFFPRANINSKSAYSAITKLAKHFNLMPSNNDTTPDA